MDPSSRSPRAAASPSADASPRPSEDDRRSPMRKKPRLDNASLLDSPGSLSTTPSTKAADCPASDSSDTIVASSDLSSSQTPSPSKIILDLRKAKRNPSPPSSPSNSRSAAAPTPGGACDVSPRARPLNESPPTQYMDATAVSPTLEDNDPLPVDIKLDDARDDGEAPNIHSSAPFDSFAEALAADSAEAAMQLLIDQIDSASGIPYDALTKLHNWLDERLAAHSDCHGSWQEIHPSRPDFWRKLAVFFQRFMGRKSFTISISKYVREDVPQFVCDTLSLYARVSLHLIADETNRLQASDQSGGVAEPLPHSAHLRNLNALFRYRDDTGIWQLMWTRFKCNTRTLRLRIAEELLNDTSASAVPVLELASILSANLKVSPQLRQWLICAIEFPFDLLDLCRQLRDSADGPDIASTDGSLRRAADGAIDGIAQNIIATMDKDKVDLTVDFYNDSLLALKSLSYEASFLVADPEVSLVQSACAQPRQLSLALSFYWAAITKGRMELRVWGLHHFSDVLATLWTLKSNEGPARSSYDQSVDCAAAFLAENRIIEYLVGPASHPELIGRSANLISFAMLTQSWSEQMTRAVLKTVDAGQNMRLVSNVVSMIGGCLRHAPSTVRLEFCLGISQLSSIALSEDLVDLVATSIESLCHEQGKDIQLWPTEAMYEGLADLIIKLSGPSMLSSPRGHFIAIKGVDILRIFDSEIDDSKKRSAIYDKCIADIAASPNTSLGSINILLALWSQRQDESAYLMQSTPLVQNICGSLLAYTRERKPADDAGMPVAYEFRVEMQALMGLFMASASVQFSSTMSSAFWDHIIGTKAIGDNYRDFAWSQLVDICERQDQRHALLESLLGTFVPSIRPENFTSGMVAFVHAAARYSMRVRSAMATPDIAVPLKKVFWNIILLAPPDRSTVADAAVHSLTALYADLKLEDRFSAADISDSHTALVGECLENLSAAATDMRAGPHHDKVSGDILGERPDSLLKFQRSVSFLKAFLNVVRSSSNFKLLGPVPQSPSSEIIEDADKDDDVRTVRLEILDDENYSRPFEIRVAQTKTCEELRVLLSRRLRCSEITLFSPGCELDLSAHSQSTVADIPADSPLLIKSVDAASSKPEAPPNTDVMNAAEATILAHFSDLYQYLKLGGEAEACVGELLQHFEYPTFAVDSILSGTTDEDQLLSNEKPHKTVYELQSISYTLARLDSDSANDNSALLCTSKFLLDVLTNSSTTFLHVDSVSSDWVTSHFLGTLFASLRLCKKRGVGLPLSENQRAIVSRLFDLLSLSSSRETCQYQFTSDNAILAYDLLGCFLLHDLECWHCFASHPLLARIHSWLLLESGKPELSDQVRNIIHGLVHPKEDTSAGLLSEIRLCFWNLLAPLVEKIIDLRAAPRSFLELMMNAIIPSLKNMHPALIDPGPYLTQWFDFLVRMRYADNLQTAAVEDIVYGFCCLLQSALDSGLMTTVKSVSCMQLATRIFEYVLFPDTDDNWPRRAAREHAVHQVTGQNARMSLFKLALGLCQDRSSLHALVKLAAHLTGQKFDGNDLPFCSDTGSLMRSSAGYVGLSNLTNTCYMNSLLAQLFMNAKFRDFILGVKPEKGGAHHLLDATKELFTIMGFTKRRFADTTSFALAVVPYDAPHIDVNIQMDVDEFCNLLFDRWEGEMDTPKLRSHFRSIYGGEMVTQIKSLDCEHVSERMEPYMAVSCEVKGKQSLQSSLQAWIEGDTMEGENKYKCESCGGKFVDAVKRSCLKVIPDSLMFHLKRFDFDVMSMQRNKINDRFEFPMTIDMRPFKYSTVNGSNTSDESDYFDLVGVLIHNGTAEVGHYYSYVKDPLATSNGQWLEFNDAEVGTFGVEKLASKSFGGFSTSDDSTIRFPKPWNAYMLFYNRRSSARQDEPSGSINLDGHVMENDMRSFRRGLLRENALTARWYCLLDKTYMCFLVEAMKQLDKMHNSACCDDHSVEKSTVELVLDYLHKVAIKSKDNSLLDQTSASLEQLVSCCSQICELSAAWLIAHPAALEEWLLACPVSDFRRRMAEFLLCVIGSLRRHSSRYGVTIDAHSASDITFDSQGLLSKLLGSLINAGKEIGAYACQWEEYFDVLYSVANLGLGELRALLHHNAFLHGIELLYTQNPSVSLKTKFFRENREWVEHAKKSLNFAPVGKFLSSFLDHVDCWAPSSSSDSTRVAQSKFCLTNQESRLVTQNHGQADARGDTNTFLVKAVDCWPDTAWPWMPWSAVRFLMSDVPTTEIESIANALITSLHEYAADENSAGFRTAQEFFRHSKDEKSCSDILRAAENETFALTREGGQPALAFWQAVAPLAGTDDGLLSIFLASTPRWAAALLAYDQLSVRNETLSLLRVVLFEPLWEALCEGDVKPSELSRHRYTVMLKLYGCCQKRFERLITSGSSRLHAQAVYDALRECSELTKELQENSEDAKSWHESEVDGRRLLGSFRRCESVWIDYKITEDEQSSETTGESSEDDIDTPMTSHFPLDQQ